ncbi:unnamed protein product [Brachionus calyciflorus]|uniref:Uncharacterized protein n=1 Tax=Brachionus calyciflorus TaxID=104777 RepID=A0A813V0J9_9BILA|nr:unnamed protein product [Brachionus calyciflorus]
MNKSNLPKKKSNSNINLSFPNDKQAFKLIKDYLINRHYEQRQRPHFQDAEISPIDFTTRKDIKITKSASVSRSFNRNSTEKEIKFSLNPKEVPDDSFKKQKSDIVPHTTVRNSYPNKIDLVATKTDSSANTEPNTNKDSFQHKHSVIPSINNNYVNVSDIKSKPKFFFNYRQCGFKYEDITNSAHANYFKVNVGAPRNWLKSKFQHSYKFMNESYMIAN